MIISIERWFLWWFEKFLLKAVFFLRYFTSDNFGDLKSFCLSCGCILLQIPQRAYHRIFLDFFINDITLPEIFILMSRNVLISALVHVLISFCIRSVTFWGLFNRNDQVDLFPFIPSWRVTRSHWVHSYSYESVESLFNSKKISALSTLLFSVSLF